MKPFRAPLSTHIKLSKRKDADDAMLPDDGNTAFLRNAMASGHINILLGSAFSIGVVPTLGWREQWFRAVEQKIHDNPRDDSWRVASNLLRAEYFRSVMLPLKHGRPTDEQRTFLKALTDVVDSRGTTTVPRRANVFTTNYDPLIELSLEHNGTHYNDGFSGRTEPTLDLASYSRLQYEQSLFMEYVSPVTTVNVLKPHGSLTWRKRGNEILYSSVADTLDACLTGCGDAVLLSEIDNVEGMVGNECDSAALEDLENLTVWINDDEEASLSAFRKNYDSVLCLVNPAKSKFEETVLEGCYYDLLRIYANELDRNNALLLVSGFSFRDEHIRELTIRAARSNPQLLVLIACHAEKDVAEYERYFGGLSDVYCLVPEDGKKLELKELTEVLRWVTR